MEGYSEVENDTCDAYKDATDGTAKGRELEGPHHNLQMVRHVEEEEDADRSQLINMGVFKPTSGNATKRLRMRQETRGTTKAAEATLKQIATQEFQAEKGKMEIWRQMIMQEVGQELQAIRQVHEESMEAQRHSFKKEIEMVKERLRQQSALFANEIKTLKTQKQAPAQQPSQHTPTVKNVPMVQPRPSNGTKSRNIHDGVSEISDSQCPGNSESHQDINATPVPSSSSIKAHVKRRDYASVAASKPVKTPEQPWTQVSYGIRKSKGKQPNSGSKQQQLGQRILFPQNSSQEKSEADLILALNEALQ